MLHSHMLNNDTFFPKIQERPSDTLKCPTQEQSASTQLNALNNEPSDLERSPFPETTALATEIQIGLKIVT